jgi:hypothetical protein
MIGAVYKIHFLKYVCACILVLVIIKDRSNPVGVNKTTGQASLKVTGINKVGASNNGEVVGRDMVKALTAKQDTISRDMVTATGTAGINSIITTNIGASNNKVDKPLRLAAKL